MCMFQFVITVAGAVALTLKFFQLIDLIEGRR